MTSRRFSERTARTDRTERAETTEKPDFSIPTRLPRRSAQSVRPVRRGLKKRGVLPSFGDIILPIVGVFAVVLLVIFGRQFFINGMKSSPGIASTRAYAQAPAILAELERSRLEAENLDDIKDIKSEDLAEADNINNINNIKKEEEDIFALAVAVQTQNNTQKTLPPAGQKTSISISNSNSNSNSNSAPAKTQKNSSSRTGSGSVSDKQWRVQVGAYTTKAGAQDAANKIKKSGYSAVVYSNPASKHFKVWVAGGADKRAADNVVKAMQNLGFKGSFSFPPAHNK